MAKLHRGWASALLAAGLGTGAAVGVRRWLRDRSAARRFYEHSAVTARDERRRDGRPRLLILGAGFGGLTTAIELGDLVRAGLDAEVLLVDRVNYHLFTPMLYQVATGLLEPGHVAYPVRAIARDHGFQFVQGQVESIELKQRRVKLGTRSLEYDYLVLALGSTTNYFGNDSIREHALGLKNIADAVAIRNQVVDCFERAVVESDPDQRRALLTFVIVGGGATGIELIGSLHSLIHNGLLPIYPGIDAVDVRLILAEAGPRLLNGMDPWLGETAQQRLEQKGIVLHPSNPATSVTSDGIHFKDGSFIPSRTVVWAAGVRPSPLMAELDVEMGRDGRLVVGERLRLAAYPDVFVIGDCAWFPVPENAGRPAPPNGQTAVREGRLVAKNVAASLRNEPLATYTYHNEGNLVALGQGDGVALLGSSTHLQGLPAWLVWRGFYLSQLMGFKNRLEVLVEWTTAYFGQRATSRLDVMSANAPAAPLATAELAPTSPPAAAAPPDQPVRQQRRRRPGPAMAADAPGAASPTLTDSSGGV
jgi:NADH dehydrogenase